MSGFEIQLPSSPDPLGNEGPSDSAPVPPSTTRRLLQSAVSSRFSARPGTSPRKQMFALDVGSEITPRTIFVTVEAGQDGNTANRSPIVGPHVQRRLFGGSPTPQPSPQRRVRTTTTTVPLRGLSDDEVGPTSGRRRRSSTGRPGTPAAASTKRKKKGTPTPKATKRTPKKPRGQRRPSNEDVDIFQANQAATPIVTPRRRGRPPKRKLPEDPAEQDDPSVTQTLPRKKGGRQRGILGTDDVDVPVNERNAGPEPDPRQIEVGSLENKWGAEEPMLNAGPKDGSTAVEAEDDGDIWMDNTSDQAAANDQQEAQAGDGAMFLEAVDAPPIDHAHTELADQGALAGESDDYALVMGNDDRNDVESNHSEHVLNAKRLPDELEDQGPLPGEVDDYAPIMDQDDHSDEESLDFRDPAAFRDELDHTVDPESFTMIGLESMQSFRASGNVATSDSAEIGEGTSLFINKTLESLRQEIAESDEDDVDILISRDQTPAENGSEIQHPPSSPARIRLSVGQSPANRSSRHASRSADQIEPVTGSVAEVRRHEPAKSPARTVASPRATAMRPKGDEPTDDEDSFSDIPDEAVAAAESDKFLQYQALGPTKQEVAWTASFDDGSNHLDASSRDQDHSHFHKSHATPPHHNHSQADGDQEVYQQSASRSAQSRRSNQPIQGDSPPQSLRSRTESNRLLTPDATTSSSTQSPLAALQQQDEHGTEEGEGHVAPNELGSSPPEITTFIVHRELSTSPSRRNSDTPVNSGPEIHVERVQERHNVAAVLQPALLGGSRPTLSPVVRIGRTLQNILSDPPSPSGASSFLGSPFKGSVRNSSPLDGAAVDDASHGGPASDGEPQNQSAEPAPQLAEEPVQSPGKPWALSLAPLSSIKKLVSQGALLFTSPNVNVSQEMEDPFAPSSPTLDKALDTTRNSAFMERIRHASREGSRPGSRLGRKASANEDIKHQTANMTSAPRSGLVGIAWPPRSTSVGSEARPRSQRRQAAAPVRHDGAFAEDADELDVHRPVDRLEQTQVEERSSNITTFQRSKNGDESAGEDDTEVEEEQQTREASLTSTREHQEPNHTGSSTETDQDAIEMNKGRRVVESQSHSTMQRQEQPNIERDAEKDELELNQAAAQVVDASVQDTPADDEEDEDIWAIEADRTASSPRFEASQQDTSNLFRKSELSIDWGTRSTDSRGAANPGRSPAFRSRRSIHNPTPEDLEDFSLVDLHSSTPAQPAAKKPTPESQQRPKQVDLSDFFSSSPNFIERQRRAKQASLAKSLSRSAAVKPSQVTCPDSSGQVNKTDSSSSTTLPTASRATRDIFPPAEGDGQDTRRSVQRASSSATPEQARHRVPGHRLTPRGAQNDAALFESWSISSRAPTERVSTSEACSTPRAVTPLARESSSFESPDLRPLPDRAASPAKSCLRSLLKPRTPGRLVDFTSSTLSETAPLQALDNSQRNHPVAPTLSTVRLAAPLPGKENETAVHNDMSPPALPQQKNIHHAQQQQEPVDSPLSQNRWSRDHWLYLDELWQEYQHRSIESQRRYSNDVMASPGKRPSSSLLGKVVTNQGETLELQQMHLDVVDAFKTDVGGWDEESLAKRLFALIVGAERRRSGLVPTRR